MKVSHIVSAVWIPSGSANFNIRPLRNKDECKP